MVFKLQYVFFISVKVVTAPTTSLLQKMSTVTNFETITISTPQPFTYQVVLNRPDKLNSMSFKMFR